jgi:DNA-binding PadR family transcriptional regulator
MRVRAPSATAERTLTTTEAAVLALLAIEGERSGYDLLKLVAKAIAYIWAPARSQLYTVLPRLARDGLAQQRRVVQTTRPDKLLYRISPAGRDALTRWLETPERGAVDAFYLRLFVGRLMAPDALVAHVEQFRRDTEERLAELRRIEPTNTRTGNDVYHYFLLRFGIERAEHALAWSAWVLDELAEAS